MNKKELIATVAQTNNISKAAARRIILSVLNTVTDTLAIGEKVILSGFGSFSVIERSSRSGRNPQNGERLPIPARNVVRFRTGKRLDQKVR